MLRTTNASVMSELYSPPSLAALHFNTGGLGRSFADLYPGPPDANLTYKNGLESKMLIEVVPLSNVATCQQTSDLELGENNLAEDRAHWPASSSAHIWDLHQSVLGLVF